jgi:uncharacterized protein YjbI with pentapeptide repeats
MIWLSQLFAVFFAAALLMVGGAEESLGLQEEIEAKEVLDKIAAFEPVDYEGVSIAGDLNISGLPPGTEIKGIRISGCVVEGSIRLEDATIAGPLDLGYTTVKGTAILRRVNITGNATFPSTRFNDYSEITSCRFGGVADFNGASFDGFVDFTGTKFDGDAIFSFANFKSDFASFPECRFGSETSFRGAKFGKYVYFQDTVFNKNASFNFAEFPGYNLLANVTFNAAALFESCIFSGQTIFGDSTFNGSVNMFGAKIGHMLLPNATFGKRSQIFLNNSEIQRFVVPWSLISRHLLYNPAVYLSFVENYRSLGWWEDSDDCYYDYRWYNQRYKPMGWSKAIDFLAWISCGYGVRPGFALIWSLITIIVFAVVFWAGDGIRRSARPFQGGDRDPVPEKATFKNALFFSTMIFLSQGPIDFLPVGRHRYNVIIEGIIGWLLLALFLVTLGRVMIR